MTFEVGNTVNLGRNLKPFRDALRLSIAAAQDSPRSMRRITDKLLAKAAAGDLTAMAMLAERTDGKVAQPVGGSDELGPQKLVISWRTDPEPNDIKVIEANGPLTIEHDAGEAEVVPNLNQKGK